MKDQILDISTFQQKLAEFAKARDWEQFHNPKNLAMALSVEAGELVEIFQWLTPQQAEHLKSDPKLKLAASEELCDILTYLLRLSDLLEVDLPRALENKFQKNGEKYPVEKARGSAKKYTEL